MVLIVFSSYHGLEMISTSPLLTIFILGAPLLPSSPEVSCDNSIACSRHAQSQFTYLKYIVPILLLRLRSSSPFLPSIL
ncbi:hypothetical protein BDN72DRAFT_625991 [Pluteus cervinus]|uniref:Uncharacterized protein n=1 Tax=Pluteus cervinus TaxID=181527 RepID=A0ACD3ASZ0_9AGAR|nr:hypothetical protein BDN72DRAFT_625991 [Pluteus cervinus]